MLDGLSWRVRSFFGMECRNSGTIMFHLSDGLALAWPVLILYPEFSQSDFLEAVSELV